MIQCKDIPDEPILRFLSGPFDGWPVPGYGTWFSGFPNSVLRAMPDGTPEKLALAKMGSLIRRELVSGCDCGCRGDFEITENGREILSLLGSTFCTECGRSHQFPTPKFHIGQRVLLARMGHHYPERTGETVTIVGVWRMLTMPCDEVEYITSLGDGAILESRFDAINPAPVTSPASPSAE